MSGTTIRLAGQLYSIQDVETLGGLQIRGSCVNKSGRVTRRPLGAIKILISRRIWLGEPVSRALPSISLPYRLLTLIYRKGGWVVGLGVDSWSWDVITSRSIVSPSLHTVVERRLPVTCVSLQKSVTPFLTFGV